MTTGQLGQREFEFIGREYATISGEVLILPEDIFFNFLPDP
jgi:hypothetical protein